MNTAMKGRLSNSKPETEQGSSGEWITSPTVPDRRETAMEKFVGFSNGDV